MQYYRCKCSKAEAWGSMPPTNCQGCPYCNTTLTQHPDYHQTPAEHKYVTQYDENTGKPYEICLVCCHKREKKDDE